MATQAKTAPAALNAHKSATPAPKRPVKRPGPVALNTPKIVPIPPDQWPDGSPDGLPVDMTPILPKHIGPSAADRKPIKIRGRKPAPAPVKPEPIAPAPEPVNFDVTCMDAFVSIYNPKTGNLRRFRIDESRSAGWEGRRIISVWDRHHFVGFAEATEFGIEVWRRFWGIGDSKSVYQKYADMLERPNYYSAERGLVYTIDSMDHEPIG